MRSLRSSARRSALALADSSTDSQPANSVAEQLTQEVRSVTGLFYSVSSSSDEVCYTVPQVIFAALNLVIPASALALLVLF